MEVEAAARRQFLTYPAVTGYVQDRVWKYRLEHPLEGTGGRAIVVRRGPGWTSPQPRNTQEYPILTVQFWADHQRNEDGTIAEEDGETAAWAMYRALDPLIHGQRDVRWGAAGSNPGLFIVGCSRFAEARPVNESTLAIGRPSPTDSDNLEVALVVVDYALQIIH